jgi:hypothetical protein
MIIVLAIIISSIYFNSSNCKIVQYMDIIIVIGVFVCHVSCFSPDNADTANYTVCTRILCCFELHPTAVCFGCCVWPSCG